MSNTDFLKKINENKNLTAAEEEVLLKALESDLVTLRQEEPELYVKILDFLTESLDVTDLDNVPN